ncbi:MAG: DUF4870 domain-containing protein [Opitutales bacterium]
MENDKPAPESEPTPPAEAVDTPAGRNDHTMGMLCHLLSLVALIGVPLGNIVGPLIIWLIKRQEDPFVDACGKESLNFQISATIVGAVLVLFMFPLMIVPLLGPLLIFMLMLALAALVIAVIVFAIIASIKASEGTCYRYPYSFRFIK